ncbi:MAG: hypothetical protein ACTSYH_03655 [Candidatus Heimdallarchaeaceae archaeon]
MIEPLAYFRCQEDADSCNEILEAIMIKIEQLEQLTSTCSRFADKAQQTTDV